MYPLIVFIIILLTIFSLNSYKGKLNGEDIGLFGIITKLFVYYKVPLTSIISLIVVMNTYRVLGSTSGFFCIITVILIYFGIISFDLFKSIPEKHLSPMVSTAQASKTCTAGVIQAGGGGTKIDSTNFNAKLKQISKQLSKQK